MLRPCAKASALPGFHMARHIVLPDRGLMLVRREDHDEVGPFRRLGVGHDLEAGVFRLLARGRTFAQRDGDIVHAAVAQVLRMGMALAAIADNRDFLVPDQVQIGVGVVIDFHVGPRT